MFNKVLPQPSEIITVTLPRPMGVVFEFNAGTTAVAGTVPAVLAYYSPACQLQVVLAAYTVFG